MARSAARRAGPAVYPRRGRAEPTRAGTDVRFGGRRWYAVSIPLPPRSRMPDFELVAAFQPTGDQPQAIERLTEGLPRASSTRSCWAPRAPARPFTIASIIAQRPASRRSCWPTTRRSPRSSTASSATSSRTTRSSTSCQLLRLLPARGVPAAQRHVHREGLVAQRRDRQAAPRRHAGALRAPRRHHRRLASAASTAWARPVDYGATVVRLRVGGRYRRDGVLRQLVDLQYQRNDQALVARPVPRPRRHARAPAGLRRLHRPRPVLRRRGRAHHASSTRSPASCWPSARS